MTFRALLVTKDDQAVEVLAPVLQDFGLRVQCCGYSDAACLVTEQRFQAVLVDFDDPHSASLILKNISSGSENHPITVALLSDKNKVRNVFGAGANFVLYKPISADHAETTLRAATALIKSERRISFRVPIQVPVKVRLESAENPRELDGILLDLSDSGMDVLVAQALHPGASLQVSFALPNSPAEFELMGEVAWANPNGESGVRFVDIPESLRAALRCWLRENAQAPVASVEALPDCKLTDLSLGGCYIETASPFPERVRVAVTLRADGMELQALGLVRVMHPSRGMGIELAKHASGQRAQTESFIQFLISHPGIEPQALISPQTLESAQSARDANGVHNDHVLDDDLLYNHLPHDELSDDDVEDPLLDLLRNHEPLSEEVFFDSLRGQRSAEFVGT
jgi:DNA-binding response OmpR family regulator